MTKIDIISGFLGAGKTTLIKKLLEECYKGQKLVLIENEFGEIGIDGGFLKESGIQINELNSGCICCSLVGDFGQALKDVITQYHPDRVIIEPSGVGKLSDVALAVQKAGADVPLELGCMVTVVNAAKCKMYAKNFGEFFNDQVAEAGTVILSRTGGLDQAKLDAAVELLRTLNPKAAIVTTPWDQLSGQQIMSAMEGGVSLAAQLLAELDDDDDDDDDDCCGHDHEHHHHDHDHEHEHHHHDHDDDDDHDEHEHHHHDHDECCDHDHDHEHHHHDHDHDDCCGHDHDHHHHHHADEVFTSWGMETAHPYTEAEIRTILTALDDGAYGQILRAKGIVPAGDGKWLEFDFVPGEQNVRPGSPDVTGRLCVIGSKLNEDGLKDLFQL